MSLLFYIDTRNNTVLHPEVVKLCPSFQTLSEKEILFIVLAYDYCSIYKQFPEHERKRKAMFHAFEDNEDDLINSPRIKMAIQDYMSLQYNPNIEAARVFQQKADKILLQLQADDAPSSIIKLDGAFETMQKRIRALETEVDDKTISDGVIKGKMTLSYLEKLMSNQKHFKSVTTKK